MPFPLAHPAAVLPLRRYCPRFFSFPALIIGSLSPDLGYCFGPASVDQFSHRLLGSVVFCLPMGLLLLGLLYAIRSRVVGALPEAYQRPLLPLCTRPIGSPFIVVTSLLLGTWTHILWDSFTHKQGWFVQHLSFLQIPLGSVAGHIVRTFHFLWYACSFFGVVFVFLAYSHWQQASAPRAPLTASRANLAAGLLVGILVVPIELIHHLVPGAIGPFLVALSTSLLVAAIALTTRLTPSRVAASLPQPPKVSEPDNSDQRHCR